MRAFHGSRPGAAFLSGCPGDRSFFWPSISAGYGSVFSLPEETGILALDMEMDMLDHQGTTTLILIRHGQTAWNDEGRIQGQQDVELDEKDEKV